MKERAEKHKEKKRHMIEDRKKNETEQNRAVMTENEE